MPEVLVSALDASVNFVEPYGSSQVEARYVRRCEDYFIVYVSSQTGCKKACRFCHLTQSGQTVDDDVAIEDIVAQARTVLGHYDQQVAAGAQPPARRVHFNFMSRGEVFANEQVRARGDELVLALAQLAGERGLHPVMKFSTIIPRELEDVAFTDIFSATAPDLYYSLYTMDESVRRRWMPKAISAEAGLDKLVAWQQDTSKMPMLHWAFIDGVNDDERTVYGIVNAVNARSLRVAGVNLVAYNPFSERQGREPSAQIIERNAQILEQGLPGARIYAVPRVGFDVKASCGMFVGGRAPRTGRADLPVLG